jgi:hypothetical protein
MYHKVEQPPTPPENFQLPFEGKLAEDNRWVIMSSLIPWSEFEEEYAENFSAEMGAPAKPFRMALGSLIIKERLGISDRETVEQIRENPYLQYFIGLTAYSNEAPFEASMLVHFRERINGDLVNKVNKRMVSKIEEGSGWQTEEKKPEEAAAAGEEISELKNQGKLILDVKDKFNKKPRTHRKKARKDYLEVSKKRRPSQKQRRKAIKKQLQYIKRNLAHIEQLIAKGASLEWLSKKQYKMLLVVTEVYRQQAEMFENNKRSVEDRIVSLTQPHVRPIVRGKAGKPVEFGAKLSASYFNGYVFLDHLSWDNFNESGDLKEQIEEFKRSTGFYPESVHVDKIYRTRENRAYCRERGIRMSGPPLGRPPANISKEDKRQALEDEKIRNYIEGKFGQAKRRFSLNRVMAKLSNTSETAIAITFLVMNLSTLLRQVFGFFWANFKKEQIFSCFLTFRLRKVILFSDRLQKNLSF